MTLVRSVVLATLVALAGCIEPTALRPPHPEDQTMERGRTVLEAPREELAGPERRAARDAVRTASLSPEQNEALFRDFDDYLRPPGSHHGDTPARPSTSPRPPGAPSKSPLRRNSHRRTRP